MFTTVAAQSNWASILIAAEAGLTTMVFICLSQTGDGKVTLLNRVKLYSLES